MTEALQHPSAEQSNPQSPSQQVGATALGGLGKEVFSEITMADLVDLRSKHLLQEFGSYEERFDAEQRRQEEQARTSGKTLPHDQLATPRLIHTFIASKALALKEELPEGSAFKNDIRIIDAGIVLDRVRTLRQERNAIVQTSQRPAYMRNQKRVYMPIVAAYADLFPELHFAALLRDEFQTNNNTKYALVTTELMLATGRWIETRLKQQAQEQSPEIPLGS